MCIQLFWEIDVGEFKIYLKKVVFYWRSKYFIGNIQYFFCVLVVFFGIKIELLVVVGFSCNRLVVDFFYYIFGKVVISVFFYI